jgi:hypothetical protein
MFAGTRLLDVGFARNGTYEGLDVLAGVESPPTLSGLTLYRKDGLDDVSK